MRRNVPAGFRDAVINTKWEIRLKPEALVNILESAGFSPFTGIPCSVFQPLLDYISDNNDPIRNYLCSCEGEAMGLAAGFSLSGRLPVVYMQNDGYGNAVNPLSSLHLLYNLPALLLISWRGEPGVKDALQHAVMGRTILSLLTTFQIPYIVLDDDEGNLKDSVARAKTHCLTVSKPFAFVIRKGYFDRYNTNVSQATSVLSRRVDYIRLIAANLQGNDVLLGTTGFSGREMYQTIAHRGKFYMMGSMGCLASMGLAIALEQPGKRVILLDADGAILMKMGTLATVGHYHPNNLIHMCFDNHSYESTGAQPTLSTTVDLPAIARACGYPTTSSVKTTEELRALLDDEAKYTRPHFIHIEVSPGTEEGLGRPSTSPEEMRDSLRAFLQ
jgi:phosphonopyruvate decarboxylase